MKKEEKYISPVILGVLAWIALFLLKHLFAMTFAAIGWMLARHFQKKDNISYASELKLNTLPFIIAGTLWTIGLLLFIASFS